jgi:hypothetical protein
MAWQWVGHIIRQNFQMSKKRFKTVLNLDHGLLGNQSCCTYDVSEPLATAGGRGGNTRDPVYM